MLNDQAPRQDCAPDSNNTKLLRAREYLAERNISAVAAGNVFRYDKAEHGSRVLRTIRRRAA